MWSSYFIFISDPKVYLETCESAGQIPMWITLFGVFCALSIVLLIVVIVVSGSVVYIILKKRPINVSNVKTIIFLCVCVNFFIVV